MTVTETADCCDSGPFSVAFVTVTCQTDLGVTRAYEKPSFHQNTTQSEIAVTFDSISGHQPLSFLRESFFLVSCLSWLWRFGP